MENFRLLISGGGGGGGGVNLIPQRIEIHSFNVYEQTFHFLFGN